MGPPVTRPVDARDTASDVYEVAFLAIAVATTIYSLIAWDLMAFGGWAMATFWALQSRWQRQGLDRIAKIVRSLPQEGWTR